MGLLRQHQQRLSQMERLPDELVTGGGDQAAAAGEVFHKLPLINRVERKAADRISRTESIDLHRQPAISQGSQRGEGGVPAEVAEDESTVARHGLGNRLPQQRPHLNHMLPAPLEWWTKKGRHDRIGRPGRVHPYRMTHEPGIPLQCPWQGRKIVGEQKMLVIHTHQRDSLPGTGAGQRRLEISHGQIGPKGLQFP